MARSRTYRRGGRRHRLSGYTLTEMLIVLVIIGVIASLVVPQTLGQLGRAKSKAARLQLDNVSAALEMFAADVQRYPDQTEGLAALARKPANLEDWNGPYVKQQQLKDPWGRDLTYAPPIDDAGPPRLGTLGADGKTGGDGPDRDQFVE